MLEKHPDLFKDVSVVLNEGGGIRVGDDGRARLYSVGVAEKVPLWLKLTAPGTPGHAASPGDNQAVLKLVAALNRLASYQSPIKVIPEVQKFYADSAATAPANRREQYLDLRKALARARRSPPSFSKTAATMPGCAIRFPLPASKAPIRSM